jgi:hypothetical protein
LEEIRSARALFGLQGSEREFGELLELVNALYSRLSRFKTLRSVQTDYDQVNGRSGLDEKTVIRSGICVIADGRLELEQFTRVVRTGGSMAIKLRICLKDPGPREVEVYLGANFDVSPKQAGALKALPGVLEVVAF